MYLLEATFSGRLSWNLVRMFVLMISWTSLKIGHVGSKIRSISQILEKAQRKTLFSSRGHIVSLIIIKWSECLFCWNLGWVTVRHCLSVCRTSVRLSVHNLLVNTLASTNMNQSSPNLVKMYMTTRARMSSIMELIRPQLSESSALELENLPYLTMFTL